jgi:eukaryotic-like serine/threonine-protein kinase
LIGRTIGSYTIVDKLGSGGMGEVYLAEHRRIARRAAIKFLLPSLSRDSDVVSRFFNEARATSVIKHPGIVEIYDCDVVDDRAYIVMEYLEGESLGTALDRVHNFAGEAASIASVAGQIASALSAAHAKGIIHRDLKPENVFLALDDGGDGHFTVKILDFGIAKLAGDSVVGAGSNTRTGSVLGTPVYMSPEQCRGLTTVDHRADIYSLGCIMFEMVTGRHVFVKEAPGDLLVAHISEPAPRVSSFVPAIPPVLDDLIARTLAKNPADRPPTMAAMVAELEELLGTKASQFAEKVPLTSTMVGGIAPRPRVGLPSPLPRTPAPSSPGQLPAAMVGGTRVITQKPESPKSSTFRHTASELVSAAEPPRSPRKAATFIVGIGLAGAVAVGAYMFTQTPRDTNRAVPESEAATSGAARPARVEPARRGVEAPEEAPEVPVVEARAPIRIESKPANAELWIDGENKARGRTPLDVALPRRSSPVEAVLKAPGYTDLPISIDPARGRPLIVELAKETSKSSTTKKTSKDPTTRRHSSRASSKPSGEQPPKPEGGGYFGVGD